MNIANKLTILRIILVPFFLFFLLSDFIPNRYIIACIIFIFAAITDHVDGKLARQYNIVTDFGKFLDPLADKILVMAAFICFVELDIIGSLPVIIILSREFIVTSLRLVASSSGKVISANIFGKAKTVSQMITIVVILFLEQLAYNENYRKISLLSSMNASYVSNTFCIIENAFVWISVLFTVISGVIYVWDNRKFISCGR